MKKKVIVIIAVVLLLHILTSSIFLINYLQKRNEAAKDTDIFENAAIEYLDEQVNSSLNEDEKMTFQARNFSFTPLEDKTQNEKFPYEKVIITLTGGKNKFELFIKKHGFVVTFERNMTGILEITEFTQTK